jgi:carotenoid cleavage dioxygenase-like enzyme
MPHTPVSPKVPRSLLRAERRPVTDLPLAAYDGAIPADLAGHVFFVGPVGTVAAPGLPDPDGNTVMNGDGMIGRLDLGGGSVRLTTRLAVTPDLIADRVTHQRADLDDLRFISSGIARVSFELGARVFANTAFVPARFPTGAARLFLTYDAGRPMEIDPVSLEVVTPVGGYPEWRPETLETTPFPLVLSPAHPAFDTSTGELFTANYGRGVASMVNAIPLVRFFDRLPSVVAQGLMSFADVVGIGVRARGFIDRASTRIQRLENRINDLFGQLRNVPEDYTEVVRWDGIGSLERFRLVNAEVPHLRVIIAQSIHQIAVTRHYIVLMDTAFKIGPDQGFNDVVPETDIADRFLRTYTTSPQVPYTAFWIVDRADLANPAALAVDGDGTKLVKARRAVVPLEADHFVADFDDTDGIVLHVAHAAATDLSEWVRPYDVSAFSGERLDAGVHGMLAVGSMDLNRLGRYRVRPEDGTILDARLLADDRATWALALYAGRGMFTLGAQPEKVEHLYWVSEGFFEELLTQFVFDLYSQYPHRVATLDHILGLPRQGGRPCVLLRLDTGSMQIGDRYEMPPGTMIGSLQFVPRPAQPGATAGYLICTVYTDARPEVWIFDAEDLTAPRTKLWHPDLAIGFSLHSAYFETLDPRTSTYAVSAAADLGDLSRFSAKVRRLLEDDVIPEFYGPTRDLPPRGGRVWNAG